MCRNPTSTATTGISQVSRENEARKRKEKLKKRRKETRRKRGKHDKGGVWTAHTKQEFVCPAASYTEKGRRMDGRKNLDWKRKNGLIFYLYPRMSFLRKF